MSKPYIFEIDLVRASTAFTVVAIHSISTLGFLVSTNAGIQLLNIIVHSLHYNREVFMFVTGLVLTYIYYERGLPSKQKFWLNRLRLIFIPYVLWTIIYVIYANPGIGFGRDVYLSFWNTLTGNAAPQLYYISLTLQFCAIFPWFLTFMRWASAKPWKVLSISLALQLALIALDFYCLQNGNWSHNQAVVILVRFQNRLLPLYQFFFILGGFAAIYMEQCRAFLKRYGRYIPLAMTVVIAVYIGWYYLQINDLHTPLYLATSVLQPSVVLFSTMVIVFFSWIALHWAKKRPLYSFIKNVSDTSFGIYFVHILLLDGLVKYLLPVVPDGIPVPLKIAGITVLTFSFSAGLCYVLFKIPLLSWTIGRARKVNWRFKKPTLTA